MSERHTSPVLVGVLVAIGLVAASLLLFGVFGSNGDSESEPTTLVSPTLTVDTTASTPLLTAGTSTSTPTSGETTTSLDETTTSLDETTTSQGPPMSEWVDRRTVGQPWGDTVTGLLTFRGNPTNTWYGTGPVPATPGIEWKYPEAPMCSQSTDLGVTSTWCGNGWTGQPVIWERPDGITEMIFGAYDRRLHFVDTATGRDTRSPFATGDIIKGTPTIDPDGYPLVYFGSRDNELRILALDQGEAIELWSAVADLSTGEGRWNDDWDASPRIVNDIMFEGSENSLFYIWKLNRGYDADGLVTVDPVLLFKMETWTNEIIEAISPSGYMATSVENSAVVFEGRVYFATSAGRVLGLDITNVESGRAPIVFDYWVGDDVDASIVADEEGMLYVSAEYERYNDRARSLGQLIKLNPYQDDPYVWGMFSLTEPPAKGGLWSTPALGDGVLYAVTNKGFLIAVDKLSGEEIWIAEVGAGSWSSPVVVEDRLVVATNPGFLRSYDITDPREPVLEWEFKVGEGSIEATPAVWNGVIYVGVRDGYMYAVGE